MNFFKFVLIDDYVGICLPAHCGARIWREHLTAVWIATWHAQKKNAARISSFLEKLASLRAHFKMNRSLRGPKGRGNLLGTNKRDCFVVLPRNDSFVVILKCALSHALTAQGALGL